MVLHRFYNIRPHGCASHNCWRLYCIVVVCNGGKKRARLKQAYANYPTETAPNKIIILIRGKCFVCDIVRLQQIETAPKQTWDWNSVLQCSQIRKWWALHKSHWTTWKGSKRSLRWRENCVCRAATEMRKLHPDKQFFFFFNECDHDLNTINLTAFWLMSKKRKYTQTMKGNRNEGKISMLKNDDFVINIQWKYF